MRKLTQQEIDQAPDWADKYDVSHHAANRLVGYYGECQAQFVYTKSDMWSDVHCNYAAPDYAQPIPRKEFDISEYEFDHESISKCNDELIEFNAYGCEKVTFSREDWIAGAKHFKLTSKDLK